METFPYKFTCNNIMYNISCAVDKYLLYFYIHIAKTVLDPKKSYFVFVIYFLLLNNIVTHKRALKEKTSSFIFHPSPCLSL